MMGVMGVHLNLALTSLISNGMRRVIVAHKTDTATPRVDLRQSTLPHPRRHGPHNTPDIPGVIWNAHPHTPQEIEMSSNEQYLRQMLADRHADYILHSANARGLLADDENRSDAAIEAQLALAASNAMQAIAVLIAREPATA